MLGALKVVRSILSYEYLWREVRIKGGAYGAGFITRKSGELGFYSYRDPSPEATLSAFGGAADYLRELADSGADLTRFIIGAFGEYDIITTPRTASAIATRDILVGWSDLDERRLREGMLSFGRNDLLRVADLIDRLMVAPSVSVAGPEHMLTESRTLQSVIKI